MSLSDFNVLFQRQIFEQVILPKFPSVFHLWFLNTFPDPTRWLDARRNYAHSCAIMSIVGFVSFLDSLTLSLYLSLSHYFIFLLSRLVLLHAPSALSVSITVSFYLFFFLSSNQGRYIVGLGDRHGENILMDSTTGECVHVDFNCIFNKGERFETPERVPFRLTHNMVDALGATGCEGVYRRTCEATMAMLRREVDSLMPVLSSFVHDPLVEASERRKADQQGTVQQGAAAKVVLEVEHRLRGVNKGIPLSVEGQVHQLISDATNVDNLCEMYIGWAPFL